MTDSGFSYRFRAPLGAPEELGATPPAYRQELIDGMMVERDVAVPMRDGVTILVDVFRPQDGKAAPLIAWGPYGKHGHTRMAVSFPGSGVEEQGVSEHAVFEAPDPLFWVPRGYAVINVDPRGTWFSEGRATYLSVEEGQDYYDLIEWAGVQEWSLGKVGLTGVSYLTQSMWQVAALNPPHLGAINPWEGWTDLYREVVRHGGIPETHFWGSGYLPGRWGRSSTEVEDLLLETRERPFFDEYWQSKCAPLENIRVPAFVVASWTDQGLHTRGTLEAFRRISSPDKWLEVHGRKKWAHYYDPHSLARQLAFFDRYLKGRSSGVEDWPKVRLELREAYYRGTERTATTWPVPDVDYLKLYPDPMTGDLGTEPTSGSATWSTVPGEETQLCFSYRFAERTDIAGHAVFRLWLSADEADDADIFVELKKLDRDGNHVPFAFYGLFENGPVALGWLRASRRELDPARSTPWMPVHSHRRTLPLEPGQPVALDIEVWPSGTRFEAGEMLQLSLRGRDFYRYEPPHLVQALHEDSVNRGCYTMHCGGTFDTWLQIPVLPGEGADE